MLCSSATSITNLKHLVSLSVAQDAGLRVSGDRSIENLRNQQLALELSVEQGKVHAIGFRKKRSIARGEAQLGKG
ncbi:hypothetical protein PS726_04395 [Pseudomonas fluorescens]|nr:hypothetical protein PS726_04395 [Pseudomonas fluorescens]